MDKVKKADYRPLGYSTLPNTELLEKPPRNTFVRNYHLIENGYDRWKRNFRLTGQQLIVDTPGALLDAEAGKLTANYFLSDRALSFLYKKRGAVSCVSKKEKSSFIYLADICHYFW